jgi:hypothetical protein
VTLYEIFHGVNANLPLNFRTGIGSIPLCCVAKSAESVRDVMLWIQINTGVVYRLTDNTDLKIQIL